VTFSFFAKRVQRFVMVMYLSNYSLSTALRRHTHRTLFTIKIHACLLVWNIFRV